MKNERIDSITERFQKKLFMDFPFIHILYLIPGGYAFVHIHFFSRKYPNEA